jgi:superfamily I DNA/RNA helicase
MVDEAQDSNPARRILARKLTRDNGRTFFVGDRHQAIYGFTGADNDSMDIIAREFHCRKLPLTVTYRCPKMVVDVARRYVKHITAHESAPQGEVRTVPMGAWAFERPKVLKAGDAILCRKTKPLVDEAYALIRAKIPCHVEGRDIGKGLLNLTQKWARVKTVPAFLAKLEEYTEKQVAKFMAKKPAQEAKADAAKDQLETMKVLCEKKATLEQVRQDIMDLFKDTEAGEDSKDVTLSTVHKSKGREWHNVYVLGFKEYMPLQAAKLPWEIEQETNLIYVAVTRAQSKLVLVG